MRSELDKTAGTSSTEPTVDELVAALEAVDVDGALEETAASAFPGTRRAFLRGAVAAALGAGGLLAAAPADAASGPDPNDTAILRFDLVLEYLQAALYTEAERLGELRPRTLDWARVVGAHERAHAQAIKYLLGSKAVASPSFNFRNITSNESAFVKTAVAFEDLTAALLKWQAPRLDSRAIVAAVLTLHSVETRHAAWIRHLIGIQPAATAFDKPASQPRMARLIASTHFVASQPKMVRKKRPPTYTG